MAAPPPPPSAGLIRHLGPNWYASVMGTAIVANAGVALPVHVRGAHTFSLVFWALSAVMLAVLLTARAVHWAHHPDQARDHLLDPAVAPFYGCLSMALLAVGGGTMLVGKDVIGLHAAVVVDSVLFVTGTAVGLLAAVAIPYLMVESHRIRPGSASPVWLLPLVAPMVSAALGPLLIPHLPPGQWQRALLLGCYTMFGLSMLATLVLLPIVFGRMVTGPRLPLVLTPTLFLVLGPLGQSVTAANKFADAAPGVVQAPYSEGFRMLAVIYGVPVMGFALLWFAFACAMLVRARRLGMRFSLTWWALTFPVGTCVTGAEGLAQHTGLVVYRWLAVFLYAFLLAAWATTASLTVRGLLTGAFVPAAPPAGAAGATEGAEGAAPAETAAGRP
ncbi:MULTISPECIES: TDT family transporter [unclassified Streptomyces]|uniref:TDT family transporter n=1 Tax=unclassified Streptomyces TaxID=2593676 RepID=UPI00068DDC77|nr:TDT family transporter [Streptomyces sp. NRRL F-2747]